MATERIHRDMNWTPEDRARHKAIRDQLQRERPTPQQLMESGEYGPAIPRGVAYALKLALFEMKKAREEAGISLTDIAEKSGIDKAALSRLENGVTENPTVVTLARYAAALGKRLVWTLEDIEPKPAKA
jgi:DNA-binding XRE family transcriptional regulator